MNGYKARRGNETVVQVTYLRLDSKRRELLLASALIVVARVDTDFDLRVQSGIHLRRRVDAPSGRRDFDNVSLLGPSSDLCTVFLNWCYRCLELLRKGGLRARAVDSIGTRQVGERFRSSHSTVQSTNVGSCRHRTGLAWWSRSTASAAASAARRRDGVRPLGGRRVGSHLGRNFEAVSVMKLLNRFLGDWLR